MIKIKKNKNYVPLQPSYLILTPRNLTRALQSLTNDVHQSVYAEYNQYANPFEYDQDNKRLLNGSFAKCLLVFQEVNGGRILPIQEWVDYIFNNYCHELKLVVFGASDKQQEYYNSIHGDILFVSKFNRDNKKNLQDFLN